MPAPAPNPGRRTERAALDTSRIAIVYARQSTADQVENNIYSTEGQLKLREHAERDGFPADAILVIDDDLGVSGRTIAGRIGMTRALAMMDQGLIAIVYAEDMTRLTRDEDTVDHMIIAKHCRRAGALLFMGGSYLDMRDSADRQLFKYQAVGASEGWSQHLEKLQRARRRKAEEGRMVTGAPRWGYRVNRAVGRRDPDRDKLMIHEPEAAVIRALAERLLIVGSLNELYRQVEPIYWPDGAPLNFAMLRRVLTHPVYRGHFTWGDVFVENAHEAIIAPDLAASIDALLSANKSTLRKRSACTSGVLAGLVWCPSCGRRITASTQADHPAYCCRVTEPGAASFHFKIAMERLDAAIVHDLWARLDGGLIGRIVASLEGQLERAAAVVDFGEASRRNLERRIEGLTRSLADPDVAPAARKVLLAQLDAVARDLNALDQRRPVDPKVAASLGDYRELARQPDMIAALPATWRDEPLAWRRAWVRRFVKRVDVVKTGRGACDAVIHYLDGESASVTVRPEGDATEAERELVRRLLRHPKRPKAGCNAWIRERLAAHGFERSRWSLEHLIRQVRQS